ncbi:MAG: DUF4136 domain-containing protein [Tannerellaceae bacterium]
MKKIFPLFLLILLLASCQKEPDLSKLDNDFLVFTNYDKNANFGSYNTFYVPDSVLVITGNEKPQYWTANEADDIITTMVNTMESRGYVRTIDKAAASLGLQVSYVENVNFFYNYDSNDYWWWGYPGYWGPGYWGNGWNSWYYPYPVVYSYSVGSLLTEMVDLTAKPSKDTTTKLPIVWTAYMSGLLSGSDKVDVQLCQNAVVQSFLQSPYIKK